MHASLSKLSKELENGIEILVNQGIPKLWIRSITQEPLGLLKY